MDLSFLTDEQLDKELKKRANADKERQRRITDEHIDFVKIALAESNISPESKLGREFLKQTRLLNQVAYKIREI